MQEWDTALETAQRAIAAGAAGSKLGGALRSMGDAYGGLGRHGEAESAFTNAVQTIRDDTSLWFRLASSHWVWYPGTRSDSKPYVPTQANDCVSKLKFLCKILQFTPCVWTHLTHHIDPGVDMQTLWKVMTECWISIR